jgi:uncharacterized protein with FMN-binding domain
MKQIALSLFVIATSGAYVWDQTGKSPADDMLGSAIPVEAADAPAAPPTEPVSIVAWPALPNQAASLDPRFRTRLSVAQQTTSRIAAPVKRPEPHATQAAVPEVPPPAPTPAHKPVGLADPVSFAPTFAVTPAVYIPVPQPRPNDYPNAPARIIRSGMTLAAQSYSDGVYTGPAADAYYGIVQIQAFVKGGRLTALKVLKYPSDRSTSVSINRQALPMLRDEAISAQSADVDIISGATLTSRAFIQSLGGALNKASS